MLSKNEPQGGLTRCPAPDKRPCPCAGPRALQRRVCRPAAGPRGGRARRAHRALRGRRVPGVVPGARGVRAGRRAHRRAGAPGALVPGLLPGAGAARVRAKILGSGIRLERLALWRLGKCREQARRAARCARLGAAVAREAGGAGLGLTVKALPACLAARVEGAAMRLLPRARVSAAALRRTRSARRARARSDRCWAAAWTASAWRRAAWRPALCGTWCAGVLCRHH